MVVGFALTAALCFGARTLLVERGLSCAAAGADSDANSGAALLAAVALVVAGAAAVQAA